MIYLTSSSFFSLCEGSIVVLLHNLVVMPAEELHVLQSEFSSQKPKGISSRSQITNGPACGYMNHKKEVRGGEGGIILRLLDVLALGNWVAGCSYACSD